MKPALPADPKSLARGVLAGHRPSLARSITLVESTRPDHRAIADALVEELLPHAGNSVRIGISGVPGAGKSTFIEVFGTHVIARGHHVAVLAVDPSSKRSGGSILGDKTRMEDLARDERAFIRPSPSTGTLGGVARRTREAMLVCEAAGFDVIIIETVGVGQSETAVADMVDLFLLLQVPGGGDELQGIKKGIVEIADLVVVNKADGDLAAAAARAARDYQNALHLLRSTSPHWSPPVLLCSARYKQGIDEVWNAVERYRDVMGRAGELAARRISQARAWMWDEVAENLMMRFRTHPAIIGRLDDMERRVEGGTTTPTRAAQTLLNAFLDNNTRKA
jgi:LAO/AO transport system kinase